MLITATSVAVIIYFTACQEKNGTLRDKAKYTDILSKAQQQL